MGTSTNGQLCYGTAFDEEFEFPWGDGEIEDWWTYTVHGFKHSFELFDADGNFLNGREPPKDDEVSRYFEERRVFDASHRIPVELVNYCSGDYPMYAIAVSSTVRTSTRGSPTVVDPASLVVTHDERAELLKFFADHGIEATEPPAWLLTSYWG
jgi:hypothetical protein